MDGSGCVAKGRRLWAVPAVLSLVLVAGLARPASAQIVNGSFETGDYEGWTLSEAIYNPAWGFPYNPAWGTWGLAMSGSTMERGDAAWDYHDEVFVTQSSKGLPITFQATDGEVVAFHLQNTSGVQRMFQDIDLADDAESLLWDMQYTNFSIGGFTSDPYPNYIEVNFRDPVTDNLIESLYRTTRGVDEQAIPMTPFQVDISRFAGQSVRLELVLKNIYWFDLVLDNFRIDPPHVVDVALDIELSARRVVNTRSRGVIAVSILGTPEFDAATEIDIDALRFGPGGATPVHRGHIADVNGDGIWDVLVHLSVQDLGLGDGGGAAGISAPDSNVPDALCVEGTAMDGTLIRGCGELAVVPGNSRGNR